MAHSHAEVPSLQCPQCGASFSAEIWLIVDAAERPDLLERVLDGSIHEVVCPNGHVSGLDAPLLLFRPGESPPLIFSPAQGTTAEQDREMAGGLVAGLHNALGNDWRDEWLEGLAPVPRGLLPAFLSGDEEKLREAMAAAAAEAVPPAVAEVLAALAAEGVRIGSPEDLERALAERPELAARMRAALGGQQTSGPDISPIFREAIRQAGEAEARYRATGDRAALDTAAAAWERVLNHPEFQVAGEGFQLACLNNAGGVYLRRYWAGGLLADLDRALALWQAAVGRTPADSPDRASRLNNLGTGLRARYARSGRVADLDAAIAAWQDAVGRTPTDSPDRAAIQNNLGTGLRARYARSGRVADLDAAIAAWQDAVGRTPTDSPDRAGYQNNLGLGLSDRYARSGRVADLDAAIAAWQDAVDRTPTDSPDRASRLNNLGAGLRDRYARSGRVADLDAAIAAWQDAVGRTPTDSPDRAAIQNNLGNGLRARYARSGRVADLDAAIAAYEDAVDRTPAGSPDRAMYLNNLGNGLRDRYARSGRVADLDAAIAAYEDAVGRTPTDSPDRASRLNNLGAGLSDRYARSGRVADLAAAAGHYREATLAAAGTAGETALRAARAWASAALRKREWGEALEAVEHGRDTLRRLVEINTLTAEQQSWQREVQGLAAAAAYAHAGLGDAAAAALALEAGQATRLNAALGRGRDRDLLERLREEDGGLRSAYDNAAAERRAAEQTSARDPAGGPAEDPAAHSQRVAAAQAALDEVIARIKARPGYEELFAPAGYADVAAAVTPEQPPAYLATTAAGSVIVLLHAREGGVTAEAIFADLTTDELDRLLVRRAIMPGNVGEVEGGLLPAQVLGVNLSAELAEALPQVGARLMAPLAARLRALGAPRVALIPGGQLNLLPLHAATYEAGKATLAFLDEFIVAYAPSAQTLVESRARVVPGDETKLLAVGNPMPVRRPLRWARAEAESVADLFPGDHPPLLEEAATLEAVRAALVVKPGRDVLHFACHGSFDPGDPLRSALYLAHEEPLTMAEIRDMPLAGTRLAVLSACQTGLTDFRDIPDEVVGLPAGFLQAGVAGVVSSLWPVDDAGTMLLMERFHRFRREEGLDPAAALRSAQRWLRDRTRSELSDYYGDYMRMSSETAESGHIELPGGADTARVYADPYRWAAFTMTGA